MMAVRIMTQSLFPGFSGCVRILYVSSDYRDIVFLGNAPIPKYKAPWHTRHHAERMSDDELAAMAPTIDR